MTSGKHATNIEGHSRHVDTASVKRANPHDHPMLQRSASGHHGKLLHSNQQRRGSVHSVQTMSVHHHSVAPDKPLVRRKRIRRDGSTSAVTGKQAPASTSHLTTAHRRLPTELLQDRSKQKQKLGHVGETHRRKLVGRRGRGHSLPHRLTSLDPRHRSYTGHTRERKTLKPVKASTAEAHHKQTGLVPDHRLMYRTRSGKNPFSQTDKRRVSTSSLPDSILDDIHAHPVALHHVGVPPRRQAPVSGSGERRRRLPVVQKSAERLHHRVIGPAVSKPTKHDG